MMINPCAVSSDDSWATASAFVIRRNQLLGKWHKKPFTEARLTLRAPGKRKGRGPLSLTELEAPGMQEALSLISRQERYRSGTIKRARAKAGKASGEARKERLESIKNILALYPIGERRKVLARAVLVAIGVALSPQRISQILEEMKANKTQ